MRQLVYTQPGRVEWRDSPGPELTDEHSALVEPLAVARCDLDAPMVERDLFPGPTRSATSSPAGSRPSAAR